ncbi:hypothetical protein KCU85_g9146, partial [Aureobasidium melanogenum]
MLENLRRTHLDVCIFSISLLQDVKINRPFYSSATDKYKNQESSYICANMMGFESKLSIGATIVSFSNRKLKYKVKKRIGSGSFSTVFEVQRLKDQKVFAMKVVPTTGDHRGTPNKIIFRIEATRLTQVQNHPHLMELLDLLYLEDLDEGGIVLQFATEGNLGDLHR